MEVFIQEHLHQVEMLQKHLKKNPSQSFSLKKNPFSSNTTRSDCYKSRTFSLDFTSFDKILEITDFYVWVEPKVTMEQLVKGTLEKGLMPKVVPEFKNITVGGAIMGSGLESSSFKFGQFCDQCIEYEVLLPSGEKLIVNEQENNDLFCALSGSYGTIALIVSVKIRLILAPQSVALSYHHYTCKEAALKKIAELRCRRDCDFLEGIYFNPREIAIIEGQFSPLKPNIHLNKPGSTWFYQHAYSRTRTDRLTVYDYLFRYDLGAFWMGSYLTQWSIVKKFLQNKQNELVSHITKPNFPPLFFRLAFNRYLTTLNLYKALHQIDSQTLANLFVIQDFYIPASQYQTFIDFIESQIQIEPLWLCPIKNELHPKFLSPHYGSHEELINIGIYGKPLNSMNAFNATMLLEEKAIELGGRKMLYSQSHYSKEQFWNIYDLQRYNLIRKKYGAEHLLSLDEKVLS